MLLLWIPRAAPCLAAIAVAMAPYSSSAASHSHSHLIDPRLCAQVDEAGAFLAEAKWGGLAFPPPFGRMPEPEEAYIRELVSDRRGFGG